MSGYRVLRDGVPVATTATPGYTDTAVTAGTTYSYRVVALDPAGNASAESNLASATLPSADVLSFAPSHDAYVSLEAPATNYGSATKLEVDNSPVKHFLMRFTVSGLGGRPVRSAKLRLHAVDPASKGGDFRAVADTSWTQSAVTWNNAPAANATPFATLGAVAVGSWYEVDLTSLVKADGEVSLRVTSTSSDGADYYSKEGSLPPQLLVSPG